MNHFIKGVLFGSGFGIGLVIVALLTVFVLFLSPLKFGEPGNSIVGTGALTLHDHHMDFDDARPTVSGTLVNTTDKTLSKVMVEASIFNRQGCFVDKETEYFESIAPGEKVGYKIKFHDWHKNDKTVDMDYKIRIKQGFDSS